ncbi:Uncharacterised protein [Raoultella terrigena]|uniref:Uncharacterized protein n=1 Tax=Raoultella terrigena TaxID=577 RepID=A0A3P8KXH3_RAOTE|nr:Uncharacterised protein [Raoultella terrigena]
MNIAHQLGVDLNFIRLKAGQQRKSRIAGAKIVNGQAHAGHADILQHLLKLGKTGDNLGFGDFYYNLLRP